MWVLSNLLPPREGKSREQKTKSGKRKKEQKVRLHNNADAEMVGHSPNNKLSSSSQLFSEQQVFIKETHDAFLTC